MGQKVPSVLSGCYSSIWRGERKKGLSQPLLCIAMRQQITSNTWDWILALNHPPYPHAATRTRPPPGSTITCYSSCLPGLAVNDVVWESWLVTLCRPSCQGPRRRTWVKTRGASELQTIQWLAASHSPEIHTAQFSPLTTCSLVYRLVCCRGQRRSKSCFDLS